MIHARRLLTGNQPDLILGFCFQSRSNDYVISVQQNQGTLYRQIAQPAQTALPRTQIRPTEKGQGRQIQRTVSTFDSTDALKLKWSGAQQSVHIHSVGQRQGQPYQENLYYLTSLNVDALTLMTRIRAHWGPENRWHWVKDGVLQEDAASV